MISCICCHYGRTWLLAEAIQSFLDQDYKLKSELIIVNDHPEITLTVDAPTNDLQTIRVLNLPERLPTLSHKFDVGAKEAKHALLCMWDDDDLSLPHRLTYSTKAWCSRPYVDYLSFNRYWYIDQHGHHLIARGCHGADIMTRLGYWECGGSTGEGHNDQNLVAAMKEREWYAEFHTLEPFYLYRWSGIAGHHSAHAPSGLETCMERFDKAVRRHPQFKTGAITVQPGYTRETAELMQAVQRELGIMRASH